MDSKLYEEAVSKLPDGLGGYAKSWGLMTFADVVIELVKHDLAAEVSEDIAEKLQKVTAQILFDSIPYGDVARTSVSALRDERERAIKAVRDSGIPEIQGLSLENAIGTLAYMVKNNYEIRRHDETDRRL